MSDKDELIRQMAAYISGMESEHEPDEDESCSDECQRLHEEIAELYDERLRLQTERDQLKYESAAPSKQLKAAQDEVRTLRARVQQLEQERHDVKLKGQERIITALGEYGKDWTGDWLDEAVDRLARKRDMTLDYLAGQLASCLNCGGTTHVEATRHLLTILGVTVRE